MSALRRAIEFTALHSADHGLGVEAGAELDKILAELVVAKEYGNEWQRYAQAEMEKNEKCRDELAKTREAVERHSTKKTVKRRDASGGKPGMSDTKH